MDHLMASGNKEHFNKETEISPDGATTAATADHLQTDHTKDINRHNQIWTRTKCNSQINTEIEIKTRIKI